MKKLVLFFLIPLISFAQWNQLGLATLGENSTDYYGSCVSLSNDGLTYAVSAPFNDSNGLNSGEVKVFKLISGVWTQVGQSLTGNSTNDYFGGSQFGLNFQQNAISLNSDGSVIVIGASSDTTNGSNSGEVVVYELIAGTWTQKGLSINGSTNQSLGYSVDVNDQGNVIAVGLPLDTSNRGAVKVYEFISGNWILKGQLLTGSSSGNKFGSSVCLNSTGDIVAVGAPLNSDVANMAGNVEVYSYQGGVTKSINNVAGTWVQMGADITGEEANNYFGGSLSLSDSGTFLVVGAVGNMNDGSGTDGSVKVYNYSASNWNQVGNEIFSSANADEFGFAVDINGNGTKIVAGSRLNDGGGNASGQVRVFENISNTWTQIGNSIYGTIGHELGTAVGINSDGSVIAAASVKYNTQKGYVNVFTTNSVLSTNEFQLTDNQIIMYPNPTSSNFVLDTEFTIEKVEIYSLQGQLVKSFQSQYTYDVSNFSKGLYIVKVNTKEGINTKTLIIE